jgi:hypothetical protein
MPENRTKTIVTEAFHITADDGIQSLAELILEKDTPSTLPDNPISKFHFFVDPFNDALIFPRVEAFQPEFFQWAILPGQDKKFKTTKIETLTAIEELDFFLVQTTGVCNFLVIMEFYE